VDDLGLDDYYLFHATRADLLRRLGRFAEAAKAYSTAAGRSATTQIRRSRRLPRPERAAPATAFCHCHLAFCQ